MNNTRFFITVALILNMSVSGKSQPNYINDISLPAKQYMLVGVQNDMFVQAFLKRWRPYTDFVRFSGTANYSRRYEKIATIKEPETGQTIVVDLVNGDEFEVFKSITSTIYAGKPGVGSKEVVVQFLGDSFTRGEYFKNAILEKGYVPKVKCVGLRRSNDFAGQFHEGRGGWTLENYFSNNTENEVFFNPFFQPQKAYRYWGTTAFWKNAYGIENKTISTESFEPRYSCDYYDTSEFNQEGWLKKPKTNDIMFDSSSKNYLKWNGKSWIKVDENDLVWSFQYSKYLSMWHITPPKFLVVMLGLNDFRNRSFPTDYSKWNGRIESLLASYKTAVPDGKLILCTPSTSSGSLNNTAGDFTTRQNASMWEHRKNIIEVFDNRENEGIYIVDASISIDNDYGYNTTNTELPYDGYLGEHKLTIQKGNPHPYLSYPNLGISIAAFIQYHRNK